MGHNFSFCQTCETPLDCDFCDKLAELIEPGCMTLEELRAEAKRQGYKLIKGKKPRFERAEGLGGVLQALRTGRPLGKEKPHRCDSGVECHDFEAKEGAKP